MAGILECMTALRSQQATNWREGRRLRARVAQVIRRHFGVQYHLSQVGRILKQYGWSRQKPSRRAQQRDEEAIRRWKEERWPALKKRPGRKAGPSSSWTRRVATCCPWWSRPMRPGARLQCSGYPSAG